MSSYIKTLKEGPTTVYPQTVDKAVFTKDGTSTLDQDIGDLEESTRDNQEAIQDEVTRAQDAERELSEALSRERQKAREREGDLSIAIGNEVTRAQDAERQLANHDSEIDEALGSMQEAINQKADATDVAPHVVLTEAEYEALPTKRPGTFYFTYEDET